MLQSYNFLTSSAVLGLALTLTGCGSEPSQEKPKSAATTGSTSQEKPAGQTEEAGHGDHSAHVDSGAKDALKGLAELSADERSAAEKQRVCPVSGDALGSSGKPVKVVVKGKTVYLCCQDCEEALKKDPDKYLANLTDAQK